MTRCLMDSLDEPLTYEEARKTVLVACLGILEALRTVGFGKVGIVAIAKVLAVLPLNGNIEGDPTNEAIFEASIKEAAEALVRSANQHIKEKQDVSKNQPSTH